MGSNKICMWRHKEITLTGKYNKKTGKGQSKLGGINPEESNYKTLMMSSAD